MKVLLATNARDPERATIKKIIDAFRVCPRLAASDFSFTERAEDAEIILFIEDWKYKNWLYADVLRASPLIVQYPEKCFVYEWSDAVAGFLPGVYASLERRIDDRNRFRSGGYVGIYNPSVQAVYSPDPIEPPLLFSFRGSSSHEIRKKLYGARFLDDPSLSGKIRVTQTFGWFDHKSAELQDYAEELRDSKFVLCPRGIGPSSHRLFEVLCAGRVPVILSDEWVPPPGPDWERAAIQIPEADYERIPEIVRQHESDWQERRLLARKTWEDWFDPKVLPLRILEGIEDIRRTRPESHSERELQKRWTSQAFLWSNGWTVPQRAAAKLRRLVTR